MIKTLIIISNLVATNGQADEEYISDHVDVMPSGMSGEFTIAADPRLEVVSSDFGSVSSHSELVQTDAAQGGGSTDGSDGNDDFYDNSKKSDNDDSKNPYEWWTEASLKYNFAYLNSFNAS
ncbi:MAG: hypothetical protein KF820_06635 [Candidatus Paracaedibacteraceae bacterium]|nr:hypothetical protein [Candidatus Paracaedibacteraceae bacterium]